MGGCLELTEQLQQIASAIYTCNACTARPEARWPVAGKGDPTSGILLVGRNPGDTEDQEREPFVGPAGTELDGFLKNAGTDRSQLFLVNLINCHTAKDRPPKKAEIAVCVNLHLRKYILTLRPWLVIAMGAEAAFELARAKPISRKHGDLTRHPAGFYVLPTLHPAAPLHNPALRGQFNYDSNQLGKTLRHKAELVHMLGRSQVSEQTPDSDDHARID